MMSRMNIKNLNKAFNKNNIQNKEEDESAPVEERIRIANFAEELKDKTNYQGIDICFIIDATGSMGPYIEGAKESLKTIIEDAKQSLIELKAAEDSLKFSIVAYRDHPPQEDSSFVTNVCDFCSPADAEKFLTEIKAQGGGDIPEAVLDGLNDALNKVNWREKSEKFIFLVLDAPPHGKRFENDADGFPDGCPCGYSEMTLLPIMRDMKIDFTIIKIDKSINKMVEIFSQYINIDVFQPKIFQMKNKKPHDVYSTEVMSGMRSMMNCKIVSNLNSYK